MKLLIFLTLPLLCLSRMVGWYVSDTEDKNYPIEKIKWNKYTHIHYKDPIVVNNGTAYCNKTDIYLKKMIYYAHKHNVKVQWGCGISQIHDLLWNPEKSFLEMNYVNSIKAALDECEVDGIEVDYEFYDSKYGKLGIVTSEESTRYSKFLSNIKKAIGKKEVSADISIWGMGQGEWLLGVMPWINATMLNRGDFDFINVMSYHWSRFGLLWAWKKDLYFIDKWGIDRQRVNIGIPYFSDLFWQHGHSEPVWKTLSKNCPNIDPLKNVCTNTVFIGKQMNFEIGKWVKRENIGGTFPWALNYDTLENNNSLVDWLYMGLND